MSIWKTIGAWFTKEEKVIATDLAPLEAAVKADLANAGHTLESFLAQDGAAILGGAVSTLTATLTGGGSLTATAIGAAFTGAAKMVEATAAKQGVTLATTTVTAIAANITAQAQAIASGSATTANTNTAH